MDITNLTYEEATEAEKIIRGEIAYTRKQWQQSGDHSYRSQLLRSLSDLEQVSRRLLRLETEFLKHFDIFTALRSMGYTEFMQYPHGGHTYTIIGDLHPTEPGQNYSFILPNTQQ